jgi:hypothetical protein
MLIAGYVLRIYRALRPPPDAEGDGGPKDSKNDSGDGNGKKEEKGPSSADGKSDGKTEASEGSREKQPAENTK